MLAAFAPGPPLPDFLHHEVLVVCRVTDANNATIGTIDFKTVAFVGLDRIRCGQQNGKMHLFNMHRGQRQKLLDQPISNALTSTGFP